MAANNNNEAIYDPTKATRFEKYIDIFATVEKSQEQVPMLIHHDFPLSLLRQYSELAKKELKEFWDVGLGGSGSKHKGWGIQLLTVGAAEISGLKAILKWILETQPAAGYPRGYNGQHDRFPEDRTPPGLLSRLYIHRATYQLDMRRQVRSRVRSAIKAQIENSTMLTAMELGDIIRLCVGDDFGLVNIALATHCRQCEGYSLNDASMGPYNTVFDTCSPEIQSQWTRHWKTAQFDRRERRRAAEAVAAGPSGSAQQSGQP